MCDPATLAIIGAGVAAAGTGYSALAASANARGAAAQAQVNEQEANRSAADAIQQGNVEQQQHYRQVAQTEGQQRAAMAANGIDLSFGNAADVIGDTAMIGAEDAETIAQNTVRKSRGYSIQAANYESQAASDRSAASAALVKGAFGMASTIIGGASQFSKLRMQQNFGTSAYGVSGSSGIY